MDGEKALKSPVKQPPAKDAKKTKRYGVDTCWHVPVISALAITLVCIGFENSGFFYVGFMGEFNCNRSAATWTYTLMSITLDFSGIAIMILQRWFSIFTIAHFSSVLTWLGMIASAFAPSLPWMTVIFGGIHGLGVGIFTISLGIIVVMFFDKYRGVASGIKFTGFSLSSLVFARVLVLMQDEYALRGTLLLCGGIMAHATALAILLKRPHWMKSEHTVPQSAQKIRKEKDLPLFVINGSPGTVYETFPGVRNGHTQTVSASKEPSERAPSKQRPHMLRSLNVIRKPMFYVIVIYTTLIDYSKSSFLYTIVDYTMDKGWSLTEAQTLIEYVSAAQLLGCVTIPLISDLGFLRKSTLLAFNVALLGGAFIILPHVNSVSYVVSACLLLATLLGFATTMPTVLMADYLGVDSISAVSVAVGVAGLPFYLCNPMIIGVFRDFMGSYDNFYRLLAAIQFFIGIMFSLVSVSENFINAMYVVNR